MVRAGNVCGLGLILQIINNNSIQFAVFFVNLLSIVLLVNMGTYFARLIVTSLRIFAARAKQNVHSLMLLMQY